MKHSLAILGLVGIAVALPANASVTYAFTATSANCQPCGNGPQPLPSFVLTGPSFLTTFTSVPFASFTSSANLGANTFFEPNGSGGTAVVDQITVINANGTYNYDFTVGDLGAAGTYSAVRVANDGFAQTGTLVVSSSSVPEPSTFALIALPMVSLMLRRFRTLRQRG
jgi:hypothetical protein